MEIRRLMKLGVLTTISASLVGCGGGGGGTPSTVTKPGGKVIDGYIKDATVFADCNGNKKLDTGEPTPGVTNTNGSFKSFSIPASCKDAELIAMHGFDLTTGKPFNGILMAPPNSKNITTLTTLVAVNPSLKSKIQSLLSENQTIDIDYVKKKVPGNVIRLASAVGAAVNVASSISANKTEVAATVVKRIAKKLSNVTDLGNGTALADAVANATADAINGIKHKIPEIQNVNATAIESSLKQTIQTMNNEIPNTPISYSNCTSIIKQAFSNATSGIENNAIATKYTLSSIEISGKKTKVSGNKFSISVPLQNIENNKKVEINFTTNYVNGTRNYNNVTMMVKIVDENSNRTATLELSPVKVGIENGTLKSITVPKGAKLTVTRTDFLGEQVEQVVLENKQADSTFDGSIGICNSTSGGGCFYYDLAVVENKIKTYPLYEIINKQGKFDITISFDGIPVNTVTGTVEVGSGTSGGSGSVE